MIVVWSQCKCLGQALPPGLWVAGKGWGTGTPSQIPFSFISVGWMYILIFFASETHREGLI